ncbi:tRNA (uridine(54)-C5)-methyltransferase TrmA [Thiomicrospira microaerophila]|uniref:tRNA (uridine(54)-C5)-methyltransferase TrmA n=1 Tax=Thiomicrospira microaerophila TaxID=406020 RepID=UPI0020101CE7|nr:tRNA (uridine(54)-C5)-methyltransferase TrmA [Thiomicrospira microaerophila]UQB42138.1 tRNA (uridine(54)-C5)-methyltransferase TrmA [Thiomicrospira microaerophila]
MLCQVFPNNYQQQLDEKRQRLTSLIPSMADNLSVFASPPAHYRQRAEFRIWHTPERLFYAMFDPANPKQPVEVEACPMACEAIDQLMQPLLALISQNEVLKNGLFEIDFLATLSGEMLVTLIYRRKLDEQAWLQAAQGLREGLPINHLIGRSRKQKILLDQDFVIERLRADNQAWLFQQIENSFTQPNAQMAQNMLAWAREQSRKIVADQASDLLELYCGNGHFSIALADIFDKVLATEISKSSVKSAQFNLAQNQIENVTVVKMAAEEVALALQGQAFNRMADVDLNRYNFKTIFVDPPRSGLDDLTRGMAANYQHILYISCNPDTLARDLETLLQTHQIQAAALFDQFPYSHHLESGVWLTRKPA